ncbi:MAG: Crp/Fnr family transcriptional regulator [Bacteroidales bacterium]|nr:Crp/Fnr family transcriptional regulator [Bacteroidales bacterium]
MVKAYCKQCSFKSLATAKLTDNELEILESGCAEVSFKTGEIIIKQNSLSNSITYIKSGLVKIHINGPVKEKIIKIIKAPKYLCLNSNFSEKINHFSATALEDTIVCFLNLESFKKFIYENGDFAYQIILDMSKNEIKDFHSCLNNAQKQTAGRIAEAILFFANEIYNSKNFTLPISRQDLGDLVGTTRESVSRILTDFHNDKIISLEGKIISILNEKLLNDISEKG